MTFLPISSRELAVAARRPGTYKLRLGGVLVAMVVLGVVCMSRVPRGQLGHQVFSALGVAALIFCMLTGLLLTADAIAAEKQGGTIGLLFLTDLKGYDIVLGKLTAVSLNALFGLLAMFPVLAIPLLMGSVTGAEFARLMLVLGTTLFFSLSVGLAVSAMTSDPKQALGWAVLIMAVAAGLLPVLWWLQHLTVNLRWLDFLLWPSPVFAFNHGMEGWYQTRGGAGEFWHSESALWLLTALGLAWAGYVTPRTWQTDETKPRRILGRKRKPRGWERAEAANPFCRVTFRDQGPSWLAKLLLGVAVPIWLCFFFSIPRSRLPTSFVVCVLFGLGLHAFVKVLMMVESVSRVNHDRNSGALELLLVTPLPVQSILAAQSRALWVHFRSSLCVLCLLNVALISAVFKFVRDIDPTAVWMFTEMFLGGIVVLWIDYNALLWVGLWQGLTKRQGYKAVLLTALQLLGPSWLVAFLLIVTEPAVRDQDVLRVIALWFLLGMIVDAVSIRWARSRLQKRFRTVVAQRYDKAD